MFNKRLLIICSITLLLYALLLLLYAVLDKSAFSSNNGFVWVFMPFGWMGVYSLIAPLFFKDRMVVYQPQYKKGTIILSFATAFGILIITGLIYGIFEPS